MAKASRRPRVKVQPIPGVKTTVTLPAEIYECLQIAAVVEGRSQSAIVAHLLAPVRGYYGANRGPSVFSRPPRADRAGDPTSAASGPSNDRPEPAGEISSPALPAA